MPHQSRPPRDTSAPRLCLRLPRGVRPFLAVLVTLAVAAAPVRARQQRGMDEVRLVVTVTDSKGRYLSGLGRSHFSVLEDKAAREITVFDSSEAPASVGVVVDVSDSVAARLDAVKLALAELVSKGQPDSRYFITEFDTRANLLTDWTNDAPRLAGAIRQIGASSGKKGGRSALNDACAAALDKLAEGPHAKRVLVVVSDGQDNASRTSFNDLRRRIRESDVLVYSVGMAETGTLPPPGPAGQAVLTELATHTGGAAFFPQTRNELIATGERIAVELRHQYVVGFKPDDAGVAAGPKWRKIKIRVASPWKDVKGLSARSREGYFHPRAGG